MSDLDSHLLDILLANLYPVELHPSELWDYLLESDNDSLRFNHRLLLKDILTRINDQQATDLLQELSNRLDRTPEIIQGHDLEDISFDLLYRALRNSGTEVDRSTLYDWLGVGAYP